MTDLTVEMRDLDEMVVVRGSGFGVEPEPLAWNLIFEFAALHGFDMVSGEHRFFGFNNPNPSPGIPEYGYEQWMTIPPDLQVDPDGPVARKVFPPGASPSPASRVCPGLRTTGKSSSGGLRRVGWSPAAIGSSVTRRC